MRFNMEAWTITDTIMFLILAQQFTDPNTFIELLHLVVGDLRFALLTSGRAWGCCCQHGIASSAL